MDQSKNAGPTFLPSLAVAMTWTRLATTVLGAHSGASRGIVIDKIVNIDIIDKMDWL